MTGRAIFLVLLFVVLILLTETSLKNSDFIVIVVNFILFLHTSHTYRTHKAKINIYYSV